MQHVHSKRKSAVVMEVGWHVVLPAPHRSRKEQRWGRECGQVRWNDAAAEAWPALLTTPEEGEAERQGREGCGLQFRTAEPGQLCQPAICSQRGGGVGSVR
jgi:hypothetical protein